MKNNILLLMFFIILFSFTQKDSIYGRWKVEDVYSTIEKQDLKELALRKMIKDKIQEDNYYVILTKDSIQMEKNKRIMESYAINKMNFSKNKDTIKLNFNNQNATITFILDHSNAELIIDQKTCVIMKK
jgi:hypothetical protein